MKYPVSTAKNNTAVWLLFRPHRSTTYVEVVYCYRQSSVVCLLVRHDREPCENRSTDLDVVWNGDYGGSK